MKSKNAYRFRDATAFNRFGDLTSVQSIGYNPCMNTRTSQGLLSWVYKDVLINPDGQAEQELITEYDVPMHNIVMMASTPCVESYNGKVEEGVRVVD